MLITNKESLVEFGVDRRVWQGIPGVACTQNGTMFASFYSGMNGEKYGNYAVVIRGSRESGFVDAPIAAVRKAGNARVFDPVLWIDPLERLWLIWNVQPGEEVWGAICDSPDAEELSWGEEFYIGRGVMMNKPTVLRTGEWLFPIAQWLPRLGRIYRAPGMREDDVAGSYVYKSTDNGKSFHKIGGADVRDRFFDEHMILEQENGVLSMFVRTNYGIGVSRSYDRGRNWSVGEDSGFGGPCSRFHIRRLRSGRVLLINHVGYPTGSKVRSHLTALLSEDDGKTFPYSLLLDERRYVSYPDVAEDEDGSLYVIYDRERGGGKCAEDAYRSAREILIARICEEDIIKGKLVSEKSYLSRVVSKLGRLSDAIDHANLFDPMVSERAFIDAVLCGKKEEILVRVMERYPISSADFSCVDFKRLDALIARFEADGSRDAALLERVIEILQGAMSEKKEISPIINSVKAYIDEHFAEEFSISEIAEAMKISVYYLTHLFKEATGATLTEYRNEFRVTRAKELLINTDQPIGVIAQECGFCSAAYFSEVFSGEERISPREYRILHRQS